MNWPEPQSTQRPMLWRHFFRYCYARSFSLDDVQLSQGMASILTDAFWSQNEPRHVSAMDGCHSQAVPRSHRNSRWHGDLWGGPRRPWCQPHQPLKHLPEGGIGTEQQEVGTAKRASHILWSRVQCPGHASRPQEGPEDHRNDSTNGQATTSVFSRYGKLHGDLHSKPPTSHWAALGNG